MKNIIKKDGEYTIKEVFNEQGEDIKKLLESTFKMYCESILQKK